MGGMFGESKYDVMVKIPEEVRPKTIKIALPTSAQNVTDEFERHGFHFPVIFKPDLGERGFMVRSVNSYDDIQAYLRDVRIDFLVQEFVNLPLEFGVFYMRFPDEETGAVTSVVMKEMLFVTGDGKSTLKELIFRKDRAKLQWPRLKQKFQTRLDDVLAEGENLELVSIGNHALGTKFLDGTHLINEKLSATFDAISKKIDGFYFGRFDIRCNTLEDLYQGKIKVLELNGCGAEPAHIYQPGFPISKALSVLFNHWKNLYQISVMNHARGVPYISFRDAKAYYRKFKASTR
jgi:hypothetical protein